MQIGFGGSCHWCTEAIFRSLIGVNKVEQGWISSDGENTLPSEAVMVIFEPEQISLETLIAIHLHTHSCTSKHNLRGKYRSAIYTFDKGQVSAAKRILRVLQEDFDEPVIIEVLPYQSFKLNEEHYLDYYYKDPSKPFCQNIINPKLKILLSKFNKHVEAGRLAHITFEI